MESGFSRGFSHFPNYISPTLCVFQVFVPNHKLSHLNISHCLMSLSACLTTNHEVGSSILGTSILEIILTGLGLEWVDSASREQLGSYLTENKTVIKRSTFELNHLSTTTLLVNFNRWPFPFVLRSYRNSTPREKKRSD